MAHHKRGRSKKGRAGCLFCKPHKRNGVGAAERIPPSARRKLQDQPRALAEG